MENQDQQIQERAKQIGDRPYHPVILYDDWNEVEYGITIRQELMRTAMGAMLSSAEGCVVAVGGHPSTMDFILMHVNAILIQMAKDELGIND